MSRFPAIVLLVLVAAVAAAPARAADRYATATSATTTGACAEAAPCTLAAAVGGAAADDVVIVRTGTYDLAAPMVVSVRLTIRGIPGENHPKIRGAFSTPTISMEAGGTLSHLALSSSGLYGEAIGMRGGTVDDTAGVATGQGGSGLVATTENGGLLVRDSAFRAWGSTNEGDAVSVSGTGTAKLLNVTAYADTGPTGITCTPGVGGTVRIVNTLVRGAAADITAPAARCSVRFSNYRPDHATGVTPAGNNQSADPQAVNVAAGNFRLAAGSPAVDAGTNDADLRAADLDGQPRVMGSHPDIGAYELFQEPKQSGKPADFVPPGLADLPAPAQAHNPHAVAPETLPAAPPKLGKSVVLDTTDGVVRVKAPGGHFVRLGDATNLPVGTVIDATRGAVSLQTALGGGAEQTGTFSGGQFTVRQDPKAKGMTDIFLSGGSRAGCRSGKPRARAAASTPHKRQRKGDVVRRLWGKDKSGRFRTHGSKSVATVRGTRWLTEDRCDGTRTKVTEGAVDVASKRTGKVTRVRAGHDLLVK